VVKKKGDSRNGQTQNHDFTKSDLFVENKNRADCCRNKAEAEDSGICAHFSGTHADKSHQGSCPPDSSCHDSMKCKIGLNDRTVHNDFRASHYRQKHKTLDGYKRSGANAHYSRFLVKKCSGGYCYKCYREIYLPVHYPILCTGTSRRSCGAVIYMCREIEAASSAIKNTISGQKNYSFPLQLLRFDSHAARCKMAGLSSL